MIGCRNMIFILLWVFYPGAVGHAEIQTIDDRHHFPQIVLRILTTDEQKMNLFAQNDESRRSDNEQPADSAPNTEMNTRSESAPEETQTEAKRKTEPLKPFTPSEKIKADQGVDFPVDI